MFEIVAGRAKGYTIRDIIADAWKWTPRFDMVYVELTSAMAAFLTRIIISQKNIISKFFIFFTIERLISNSRKSALPIPVISTDKMSVFWWDAPRFFHTPADSFFMFDGKFPTFHCFRYPNNGLFTCGWCHKLCLSSRSLCYCGELFSYLWSFSYIVMKIIICNITRPAAKLLTSPTIFYSALEAYLG